MGGIVGAVLILVTSFSSGILPKSSAASFSSKKLQNAVQIFLSLAAYMKSSGNIFRLPADLDESLLEFDELLPLSFELGLFD